MKRIISFLVILATTAGHAQNNVQSVGGTINLSNVQSLEVESLYNLPIVFSSPEDYNNGITIPSYFRLTVISCSQWIVDVKAISTGMNSAQGGEMPVGIISLKGNVVNDYVPISNAPQSILVSTNTKIKNVADIGVRFNPGWNYTAGQYNTSLVFTLSAQ